MRQLIFLTFIAAIMAAVIAWDSPAYAQESGRTAEVTAWALNVREGPGTDFRIIGAVYVGDKLPVLSESNGWLEVPWNEGTGWISGRYVRLTSGAPAATATSAPTTVPVMPTAPPPPTNTPVPPTAAPSAPTASPTTPPAPSPTMSESQAPAPTVEVPVATATTAPAPSTSGSARGKIAFATMPESLIYTVNADGTDLRRLTHGLDPDWSPDGQQIAYSDWLPPAGIYIMNADGSDQYRLHDWVAAKMPDWSPDGKQIIFTAQKGGILEAYERCFFGRCFDIDVDYHWHLRLLDVERAHTSELLTVKHATGPVWRSNWDILFIGDGLLNSAKVDDTQTTKRPINNRGPFVDPRVCNSNLWGSIVTTYQQHDHWEVYTMNGDGHALRRLTGSEGVLAEDTGNNVGANWSPDCTEIVFFSDRDERWRPYIMNADGSNERPFLPEVFDQFTFDFTYGFNNDKLIDWWAPSP